jgi:hypothetical protein
MVKPNNKIRAVDWKKFILVSIACFFGLVSLVHAQQPPAGTASTQQEKLSFFDIVEESLFGDPTEGWSHLSFRTFFSEGWDEPFDYPTDGSGGAPRQGWINAFDGVFYRLWFLSYSNTHNFHDNGNQDIGSYTLFAPINRRLQLRFDIPFFVSNKGGSENTYNNNFGDFVVTPRLLLSETQDLSQIFAVQFRTPTGEEENGNDITSVTPQYEFWSNVTNGWVARGGIGSTLPTDSDRGRYTFNFNLGVGQYITPHNYTPIGDLTLYVAGDGFTTLDNRADDVTFLSFTPGFRNHLGRDWYLLGGVEVPVTGPDSQSFDYEPNFWLMKVF